MTTNAAHTSEDNDELRQLLAQRDAEIARQSAELLARDLLIEKLKLQLANLRRQRFGTRSEALDKIIGQLDLALVEAEAAAKRHDCEPPRSETEAKQQPMRKPLPEHLPREEVVLSPGETCEQCGGALRHLGEDVSETLEYVPGRFKVIRTVRLKMSCRCCEAIHQVPAPSMPIERGRPGPGLLAHVLVSKYADHLPLYRQSQIYGREGMPLERSTLADWVRQSAALLAPLAEAIGRHVMAGAAIHADDTPVKVLAPGSGKTKTGRLWVYLRDERDWAGDHHPAAFYKFTPDRRGQWPRDHLKDFSGWLHADGGIVTFTRVLRENGRRLRVSHCSSHGIPPIHRFSSELAQCCARDQMALNVEGVIDRCMCGEELLRRTGGLEALHPSFSPPYRVMRILGPIVDPTAGYVASSYPKFAQCRAI